MVQASASFECAPREAEDRLCQHRTTEGIGKQSSCESLQFR